VGKDSVGPTAWLTQFFRIDQLEGPRAPARRRSRSASPVVAAALLHRGTDRLGHLLGSNQGSLARCLENGPQRFFP